MTDSIYNNGILKHEYIEKWTKIIQDEMRRPYNNNPSPRKILDTDEDVIQRTNAKRQRVHDMRQGEIWQKIIGSLPGFIDLKKKHPSGLDLYNSEKNIYIELKSASNTDNSSSLFYNFNKLAKVVQQGHYAMYAVVNDENEDGKEYICARDGCNITYLSGKKLYLFLFGENYKQVISHLQYIRAMELKNQN